METRPKIILIYPRLGFVGSYVKNVPLSLVYVSTELRKLPVDIEILDLRLIKDWEPLLAEKLTSEPVAAVGVSVMSGITILNSLQVSRMAKRLSRAPVIWGGPHPTILPEEVLKRPEVDFVIRGFAAESLARLVERIVEGSSDYSGIKGLCHARDGNLVISEIQCDYEIVDFRDLPYELIEKDLESYFEGMGQRVFPIYSSVGCAYQCAFCIAPVWYRSNKRKWIPLDRDGVVDHIEWLQMKYGIDFIYFYDDDSFVDPAHFMGIAREIERRRISISLGFRGFRANEIVRLDDNDLALLERIGVSTVHVGVESGSPRMLELMKKGITLEQTHRSSRMLARRPGMTPFYNVLVGLPTETLEDLRQTRDLILRLVADNPRAIIWTCKLIPYPGSELYDLALEHGFVPPRDIEGWALLDQELEMTFPWIPRENERYIKMLQATSYLIDDKEPYLGNCGPLLKYVYRLGRALYRPLALWRLRHDSCGLLFEYPLFNLLKKVLIK